MNRATCPHPLDAPECKSKTDTDFARTHTAFLSAHAVFMAHTNARFCATHLDSTQCAASSPYRARSNSTIVCLYGLKPCKTSIAAQLVASRPPRFPIPSVHASVSSPSNGQGRLYINETQAETASGTGFNPRSLYFSLYHCIHSGELVTTRARPSPVSLA